MAIENLPHSKDATDRLKWRKLYLFLLAGVFALVSSCSTGEDAPPAPSSMVDTAEADGADAQQPRPIEGPKLSDDEFSDEVDEIRVSLQQSTDLCTFISRSEGLAFLAVPSTEKQAQEWVELNIESLEILETHMSDEPRHAEVIKEAADWMKEHWRNHENVLSVAEEYPTPAPLQDPVNSSTLTHLEQQYQACG